MNDKKINLVYIASNGRSGSTILEELLHTHTSFWALGEISILKWSLDEDKRQCGCGLRLSKCEFWSNILSSLENKDKIKNDLGRFQEDFNIRKVLRLRELLSLIRDKNKNSKEVKSFCKSNYDLLSKIQKEAESESNSRIQYLVDSSKDPYRLMWLAMCDSIDISVLHIVKDPRSYIYSTAFRRGRAPKRWYMAFRKIARYIFENKIIEKASSNLKYKRIKYENLAANPNKTMSSIFDWLGSKQQEKTSKKFKKITNHAVAGSVERYKVDDVKIDEEWKKNISDQKKKIIFYLTSKIARRYNYEK